MEVRSQAANNNKGEKIDVKNANKNYNKLMNDLKQTVDTNLDLSQMGKPGQGDKFKQPLTQNKINAL